MLVSNPQEAIRAKCRECVCDEVSEITGCTARVPDLGERNCDPKGCWLWPYRSGRGGADLSRGHPRYTRLRAIRRECLNCMGGSVDAVKECDTERCSLRAYRLGKNPKLVGKRGSGNLESLQKAREAATRKRQQARDSFPDAPESTNGPQVG